MTVYLIGFAVSLTIIGIVQQWPEHGIGFKFWSMIALAIPCFIAALRSDSIGTDVLGYARPLYELAMNNAEISSYYSSVWWRDGWHFVGPSDFEVGYTMLAWISARMFGSFQSFLFFQQVLTIGPIYIACCKHRKAYPLVLCILAYYFVYYNLSLNLMRQAIALAFVFLGVFGLYKSNARLWNQLPCMVAIVIAVAFHGSALIGFIVLAVRVFLETAKIRNVTNRRVVLVLIIPILLLLMIDIVRGLLVMMGVSSSYIAYLGEGAISFQLNELLLRLPTLILAIPLLANREKSDLETFVFVSIAIGVIVSQLTSLGAQNARIAIYFSIYLINLPSMYYRCFQGRKGYQFTGILVSIGYCAVYWIVVYVMIGASNTVPYHFFWV